MIDQKAFKKAGVVVRGKTTIVLLIIAATLIWLLSSVGFFNTVNNAVYEATPSLFSSNAASNMVTVSVDNELWKAPSTRQALINKISNFDAKEIIVFEEDAKTLTSLKILKDQITIVPIVQKVIGKSGAFELHLDEEIELNKYKGFALPPELERGKVRNATLKGTLNNQETINSFLVNYGANIEDKTFFRINYDVISPFISQLTAQQILSGKVTAQLFKNKTIILGKTSNANQSIIVTPYNPNGLGISLLQYYAISLDAVSSNAELTQTTAILSLLFILLTLSSILFLMQKLSLHSNIFVLTFIIIAGIITITILSHVTATIWPISEFILSALASYWIYFHNLQNHMAKEVRSLSRTIKHELSTSAEQISFNEVENPWLEITSFVQQYLQLNKTIFLEKVENDHRVREIHSLNCSIDDIQEMRRDYERQPYSDAIKENSAIEISRPYFKHNVDGEMEFIAPLMFAGEILGFWAMTYSPEQDWNKKKFLLNVESFSEQIGHLLYRRNTFQLNSKNPDSTTKKFIKSLFPNRADDSLKYNVFHSLKRLSLYQNIFNTMHSSAIIYDLFGRVVEANTSMEHLSNRSSLNIFNLNSLELLHNITGMDKDDIRSKLRQVVLLQKNTHFTTTSKLDDHTYMVSVSPVIADNKKTTVISDNEHPFSVLGILVEFIDVGSIHHIVSTERNLTTQYLTKSNQALSQLVQLQKQLIEKDVNAESDNITEQVSNKIQQLVNSNIEIQNLLHNLANNEVSTVLPVDLYKTYLASLSNSQKILASKHITINVAFPDVTPLVMANRDELLSILQLVFSVLTDDAQINSNINITCKYKQIRGKQAIHLSVENIGFGVPKEHIEQIGQSEYINEETSEAIKLKQLLTGLDNWNARARVHTKLGKGIRFSFIFTGV